MTSSLGFRVPPKILLVGEAAIGKTTLINCLLKNINRGENMAKRQYKPTIGAEHYWWSSNHPSFEISFGNLDNKSDGLVPGWRCEIWDLAGQERFRFLGNATLVRGMNCFLLCYGVSDRKSFEAIKASWFPFLTSSGYNVEAECSIVLVGLKSELIPAPAVEEDETEETDSLFTPRVVSYEEGLELSRQLGATFTLGMDFVEVSSQRGENVNAPFKSAVLGRTLQMKQGTAVLSRPGGVKLPTQDTALPCRKGNKEEGLVRERMCGEGNAETRKKRCTIS